jgi:hypothetical protein
MKNLSSLKRFIGFIILIVVINLAFILPYAFPQLQGIVSEAFEKAMKAIGSKEGLSLLSIPLILRLLWIISPSDDPKMTYANNKVGVGRRHSSEPKTTRKK